VSSTTVVTWVWETRSSTRRPGERWVDGVVVAIDAEIGLLGHTNHRPPVTVRQPVRQRPHPCPLLDQPLSRDGTDRAMHPPVDAVTPPVELVLEVEVVREPPAR
jgi:hypothetical protein